MQLDEGRCSPSAPPDVHRAAGVAPAVHHDLDAASLSRLALGSRQLRMVLGSTILDGCAPWTKIHRSGQYAELIFPTGGRTA